jgi:hypothetical protein
LGVVNDNWVKVWLQGSEELEDIAQELKRVIYALSAGNYIPPEQLMPEFHKVNFYPFI